jgi:hypothetical protein
MATYSSWYNDASILKTGLRLKKYWITKQTIIYISSQGKVPHAAGIFTGYHLQLTDFSCTYTYHVLFPGKYPSSFD